jgi:hypothetical protein
MTTTHAQQSWTAGDDWQINATLLDENGAPYNLSGISGTPEIKWALMNRDYKRVLDVADVSIVIVDAAAGKCSINVPAAKTSPLAAGRYTDVIRIVTGGITSTLCYGPLSVMADPWAAQAAVVAVGTGAPRLRAVS